MPNPNLPCHVPSPNPHNINERNNAFDELQLAKTLFNDPDRSGADKALIRSILKSKGGWPDQKWLETTLEGEEVAWGLAESLVKKAYKAAKKKLPPKFKKKKGSKGTGVPTKEYEDLIRKRIKKGGLVQMARMKVMQPYVHEAAFALVDAHEANVTAENEVWDTVDELISRYAAAEVFAGETPEPVTDFIRAWNTSSLSGSGARNFLGNLYRYLTGGVSPAQLKLGSKSTVRVGEKLPETDPLFENRVLNAQRAGPQAATIEAEAGHAVGAKEVAAAFRLSNDKPLPLDFLEKLSEFQPNELRDMWESQMAYGGWSPEMQDRWEQVNGSGDAEAPAEFVLQPELQEARDLADAVAGSPSTSPTTTATTTTTIDHPEGTGVSAVDELLTSLKNQKLSDLQSMLDRVRGGEEGTGGAQAAELQYMDGVAIHPDIRVPGELAGNTLAEGGIPILIVEPNMGNDNKLDLARNLLLNLAEDLKTELRREPENRDESHVEKLHNWLGQLKQQIAVHEKSIGADRAFEQLGVAQVPIEEINGWQEFGDTTPITLLGVTDMKVHTNSAGQKIKGTETGEVFTTDGREGTIDMTGAVLTTMVGGGGKMGSNALRHAVELREIGEKYGVEPIKIKVSNPHRKQRSGVTKRDWQTALLWPKELIPQALREYGEFLARKIQEVDKIELTPARDRLVRRELRERERANQRRFNPSESELDSVVEEAVKRRLIDDSPLAEAHKLEQYDDVARMTLAYLMRNDASNPQPGVVVGSDAGWGKTFVALAFITNLIEREIRLAKAEGRTVKPIKLTYVTENPTLADQVMADAREFGFDKIVEWNDKTDKEGRRYLEFMSYQKLHMWQTADAPQDVIMIAKHKIQDESPLDDDGNHTKNADQTNDQEPDFIWPWEVRVKLEELYGPEVEQAKADLLSKGVNVDGYMTEVGPDGKTPNQNYHARRGRESWLLIERLQAGVRGNFSKDRILLLDEAHNARGQGEIPDPISGLSKDREGNVMRVASSRRVIIEQLAAAAEWNVYMTATPGENPAQLAYLEAMGMFDSFEKYLIEDTDEEIPGGFEGWSFYSGAQVDAIRDPDSQVITHYEIHWPMRALSGGHEEDPSIFALEAYKWLQGRGLYLQHGLKVTEGMAAVEFMGMPSDVVERSPGVAETLGIHARFVTAYADALAGGGLTQNAAQQIGRHRENTEKRILEAIKIYWAVETAREVIDDGKQVSIFTEYLSETRLGTYKLRPAYIMEQIRAGNPEYPSSRRDKAAIEEITERRFTPQVVIEMNQAWDDIVATIPQGANLPERPFSYFFVLIARQMLVQFPEGEVYIPSPHDIIKTEAMPREARQELIELGWPLEDRDGDLQPSDLGEKHGTNHVSALPFPYNLNTRDEPGASKSTDEMKADLHAWLTTTEETFADGTGRKLMMFTSASSGTGLSLHVSKEDKPGVTGMERVQIITSLPWRPTKTIQVMGRSIRAGMTKRAQVYILLMPEIQWEIDRATTLAQRAIEMEAMVGGDPSDLGTELAAGRWKNSNLIPFAGNQIELGPDTATKRRYVVWRTEEIANDFLHRLRNPYSDGIHGQNLTNLSASDIDGGEMIESAADVELQATTMNITGETGYMVSWKGMGAQSYGIGKYLVDPSEEVTEDIRDLAAEQRAEAVKKRWEVEVRRYASDKIKQAEKIEATLLPRLLERMKLLSERVRGRDEGAYISEQEKVMLASKASFRKNFMASGVTPAKRMKVLEKLDDVERTLILNQLLPSAKEQVEKEWADHWVAKATAAQKRAKKKWESEQKAAEADAKKKWESEQKAAKKKFNAAQKKKKTKAKFKPTPFKFKAEPFKFKAKQPPALRGEVDKKVLDRLLVAKPKKFKGELAKLFKGTEVQDWLASAKASEAYETKAQSLSLRVQRRIIALRGSANIVTVGPDGEVTITVEMGGPGDPINPIVCHSPCENESFASYIFGFSKGAKDKDMAGAKRRIREQTTRLWDFLRSEFAHTPHMDDVLTRLFNAVEDYARGGGDVALAEKGAVIEELFQKVIENGVGRSAVEQWALDVAKAMKWPDKILRNFRRHQSTSYLYTMYRAAGFGYLFGMPTGLPFLFLAGSGVGNFIQSWLGGTSHDRIYDEFVAYLRAHGLARQEGGEFHPPPPWDEFAPGEGGGGRPSPSFGRPGGGGGGPPGGGGGGGGGGGREPSFDELTSGPMIEVPEAIKALGYTARPLITGASREPSRRYFINHYNNLFRALTYIPTLPPLKAR